MRTFAVIRIGPENEMIFSDPVTVFENRFVHRERKIFYPSSSFLSGPIDRYSSYDDVYRHTHADYQQPTIA